MPIKLPYLVLTSQEGLHTLAFSTPLPTSHSRSPYFRSRRRPTALSPKRTAHTNSRDPTPEISSEHASDPLWPRTSAPPSPYDVLDQCRTTPYNRRRFLALVKIYHPDRQSAGNFPHAIRVERYRLAVTAHEILRDPERRKAYDASGAGWPLTELARRGPWHRRGWAEGKSWGKWASSGHPWTHRDTDGPHQNATWEDWEEWYARENGSSSYGPDEANGSGGAGYGGSGDNGPSWGRTAPVIRPAFRAANAVILILCTTLMGLQQGRRSRKTQAQLERRHGELSRDLVKRREVGGHASGEGKVDRAKELLGASASTLP